MNLVAWIYIILFIKAISNYNELDLLIQDSKESEQIQITEKVYLHIDRVFYHSGDDIWFKAYVIDPSTNKPSVNTNNLHVELLSPASEIIQNRIVRMENGVGNGDFHVVDSLPSGKYRIRAYTNHMRNYDDKFFFIKEVTVINPYDEDQALNQNAQIIENKIDISFFPEGGSLVDNVTSTVAFKAVNALGKGCDVTVELYSSTGELLTIFNSTHLGMGFFNLKPIPGINYYTITKSKDGPQTRTDLPKSFPTGITIRTFVTDDKKIILTVNTNEETLSELMGNEITVKLSSHNLVNKITKIKIDSLINNFLIPVDGLLDGIIRVTLSANEKFPLSERLVYFNKNDGIKLNIVTDKKEYKPREKVNVKVSLTSDSTFTNRGLFSLSSSEARFTDDLSLYPPTISSWFLLESEVHGQVEEPSYYFDSTNEDRLEKLDLLLMTQGWRDFQWKYDSLSSFKHEVGFTISGRVKRVLNNNPIEGAKINLAVFENEISQVLETKTDSSGSFKFEEFDLMGKGTLVISATDRKSRSYGQLILDSLVYIPAEIDESDSYPLKQSLLPWGYNELIQEYIIKTTIQKKYNLSDIIEIGEVIITARRSETPQEAQIKESREVYRSPDAEMVVPPEMDNFAGDVFDMIQGRIPAVRVIRGIDPENPSYPNDVRIEVRNQSRPDQPGALIVLDGRRIDDNDISQILAIPAFMIDRVDVIYSSPAYGVSGANGVINIISRIGMRRNPNETSTNTTTMKVSGYDAPRIFYSPKYIAPKKPADPPDFRSTIFWEPNITIGNNNNVILEYYNADNPTTINITAEGITVEGIPITGRAKYDVN